MFPKTEFDAKYVSATITRYLQQRGYDPQIFAKFKVKRISRDLDGLYKMGFLGARRVKRQVSTKKGTKCYRGYNYIYHVTTQGWRYYKYLLDPAEATQRNRQKIYQKFDEKLWALGLPPGIIGPLPPELADVEALSKEIHARSSEKGRFNRFPYINDYTLAVKYINAKLALYNILKGQNPTYFLNRLDLLSEEYARILMASLESRKKTMLDPNSENHYLAGLLR